MILDVFSRAPLAARVFLREPSARDMVRFFSQAVRRFGPPRHSVSDQGVQFTATAFRRVLARHQIRHRYGAIGKTGSIALIERFFLTLKQTAHLRSQPPLLRVDLERRLALGLGYYVWLRPHQGLGGATPAERLLDLRPAHLEAIPSAAGPAQRADPPATPIRDPLPRS